MKTRLKKIVAFFGIIRTLIPMIPVAYDKKMRKEIIEDLEANKEICLYNKPCSIFWLNYMLLRNMPYRSIYHYRLRKHGHFVILALSKLFIHDKLSIEIGGDIRGGFRIFHGVGTVIYCSSAGNNFDVYQGVTIGRNPKTEKDGICVPTIGNNVKIYVNAVVIGNITIGDNVQIGAGAVVTKSVPSNSTVVGNPMRIIQR